MLENNPKTNAIIILLEEFWKFLQIRKTDYLALLIYGRLLCLKLFDMLYISIIYTHLMKKRMSVRNKKYFLILDSKNFKTGCWHQLCNITVSDRPCVCLNYPQVSECCYRLCWYLSWQDAHTRPTLCGNVKSKEDHRSIFLWRFIVIKNQKKSMVLMLKQSISQEEKFAQTSKIQSLEKQLTRMEWTKPMKSFSIQPLMSYILYFPNSCSTCFLLFLKY